MSAATVSNPDARFGLRIRSSYGGAPMIYRFDECEVDTDAYEVRRGGAPVQVEPQVFEVIAHLLANRDRLVTKEELLDQVWGSRFVSESALTSRVKDARRALGDDGQRQGVIRTVHGRGYRFVAELTEPSVDDAPSPSPSALVPAPPAITSIPRTRYARSGNASIAYQVVGSGDRDIVFIPGFVSNIELNWEYEPMAAFFSGLARLGRLILFDKRGTGLSDRVAVTDILPLEQRMDDVRAVMDAAGSERATLVGISEGGPLALLFAATYPDRVDRLVLCNSYVSRFRDDIPQLAAAARDAWGSGAAFATLAPSWRTAEAKRFLARYERHSATPDAAEHLIALCHDIDVSSVLPSVHAPTRVVHHRDDEMIPLRNGQALADGLPDAELVVLEGRDHFVFVDHEAVLGAVESFLTGAPPAHVPERILTTVLFADVADSTGTVERLGDARWAAILADFFERARTCLSRFRGEEVVTTGDGFLATFDGPARAVRCGMAIQEAIGGDLNLRIGVHTAEVERLGEDIAGVGVHIGARVMSAATPGEVWLTRTVRDLVAGSGLCFEPRGTHRFKGISEPWELHAARP
jgi:pimeloyl-ACP methyl ester carboxylesterase/DNA-binding winged helix-turn-helix (wHTH) protein